MALTANGQSQLKFDISNKVVLDSDKMGIETLLSVDLVPEVEIDNLGDSLKIHGVLRLAGTYLSSESEAYEPFEEIYYVIPVDITLAPERVERIEDITAKIVSFDYQVLTPHELAIEAVLVISGLKMGDDVPLDNRRTVENDRAREEYTLAVSEHRDEPSDQKPRLAGEDNDVEEDEPMEAKQYPAQSEEVVQEALKEEKEALLREQAQTEHTLSAGENIEEAQADDREKPLQGTGIADENNGTTTDEKRKTKVTFQSQESELEAGPNQLDERFVTDDSVRSPTDEPIQEDETNQSAEVPEEEQPEGHPATGVEWIKKLGGDETGFHQLKMVIVQKDDTLESIADRYDLSSVELLQVNQLESGELKEGQIVYIPNWKTS